MLDPQEVRYIKEILDKGEALPSQYKDKLFPHDKREAELVYRGKDRIEDILSSTMGVPLQTVKTFGEVKGQDWFNHLIFGDNLQAMKTLLQMKQEGKLRNNSGSDGFKLVYIDPPFATKQDFANKNEKAYSDKVAGAEFIEFLRKRLVFIHNLISEDGSLYIHLDSRKVHYVKVILDEIFGESGQTQEIIWKRTSSHSDASSYSGVHETILFYPKSSNFYYKPVFGEYADEHVALRYKHQDSDGRRYTDGDLTAYGLKGGGYIYEWKGHTKEWRCPIETMQEHERQDRLYYTKNGVVRIKRYLDEVKGMAPQDLWLDISPVNSQADERVDYPTQKPERLLERIIRSSSEEGDIVFDAFAGSGTTLAVAEKLNRRWVGIDSGKLSIYTIQKRLFNLTEHVGSIATDKRKSFDLISNLDDLNKSPGAFVVTGKARKGELVVDLEFVESIKDGFKGKTPRDFWIVCPEDKFAVPDNQYDVLADGNYSMTLGGTEFKFSILSDKKKKPKKKKLAFKPFKLLNAGLYDFNELQSSSWEGWRQFALTLFGCRDEPHLVGGISIDGYRGGDDVLVFNHMQDEGVMMDAAFVEHLHEQIGSHLGRRFFIIAPAAHVQFLTDYVDYDDTRFYFLRIPYSIINELHRRDFEALTQPVSEKEINSLVDAVGFDFMMVPEVECDYVISRREGQLIDEAVVRIKTFKSRAMAKGASLKGNRETLSMVMLDYRHDSTVFDFDSIVYADTIESNGWEIRIPIESMGDQVMIVLMDIYGNEYREVKSQEDFKRNTGMSSSNE